MDHDRDPARVLRRLDALRSHPDADGIDALVICVWAAHAHNLALLLSLSWLCLENARFADAQRALLAACRLAPADPSSYRWLGELLLRRGDAQRAERALRLALALGGDDPRLPIWCQRSTELGALQRSHGRRAVAQHAAAAWPVQRSTERGAALPAPSARERQRPSHWIPTPTPTHPGWHPAATTPTAGARRRP